MRASLITAGVFAVAVSLTQPAIAAVGTDIGVSPSSDLITAVKAKKRSKTSTRKAAPDESGTAATGSNATPGGK